MAGQRLLLHPSDATLPGVDRSVLQAALTDLGLMGAPLPGAAAERFLVGERFLDLVTFLGCSPHIRIEPDDSPPAGQGHEPDFCHVRLPPATRAVRFLHGSNTVTPRCPVCRTPVEDWRLRVTEWTRKPMDCRWRCPACAHGTPVCGLNWRQSATCTRQTVEIRGVHPAEAVPGEELLRALRDLNGAPWSFTYLAD